MRCSLVFLLLVFTLGLPCQSALPTFAFVKDNFAPSDLKYYDREGKVLQAKRVRYDYRSLSWVSLQEISSDFVKTILFSEDKKFFQHSGVDSLAFVGSLFSSLRGEPLRGGSTITMQLVGLLDPELHIKNNRRTLTQKIKQIQRAIELEETWTKEEILTAYLNLVYFRSELRGIGAASMGLFNKEPFLLTPNESYLLTVLIRSPQAPMNRIVQRGCSLKKQFEEDRFQSCQEFDLFVKQTLFRTPIFISKPSFAPHLIDLLSKDQPYETQTTISLSLQTKILSLMQENLKPLESQNVDDGAVLVIHNRTGYVLAYVANQGKKSKVQSMDLIQARRQAGSTLKPFVYAQGFEEKKLNPLSMLNDAPIDLPVFRGIYRPLNYSKGYQGKVTVTQSLGSSLNIPAVRALSYLDMGKFLNTLSKLGFKELAYPEFYGPSLALGSADITLWELTNAYRTLANGGKFTKVNLLPSNSLNTEIERPEGEIQVYRESVTFLIQKILSDREARALSFGWESNLSTPFYTAVKTGTSQDMRDNWCVGFSSEFTVGVWIGNTKGEPMRDVTGVSGAGPIWREVMEVLHQDIPSNPPTMPSGVIYDSNKQAYFEIGMEELADERGSKHREKVPPKILVPADETIYAFDPDIPVNHQKIYFKANVYHANWNWVLNQKVIGDASIPFFWTVEKGIFILELQDQTGKVLDKTNFEVR
ncbi:penicillin-binding protein 1C [Leptospira ognonensis]|nr:penicillin-binding protein 1C [Leptospira ognonensis]